MRETYGVVLFHSLSVLSNNGRLVFIMPDTFLWLHRHDYLRRTVLKNTTIEEVALFPSKFWFIRRKRTFEQILLRVARREAVQTCTLTPTKGAATTASAFASTPENAGRGPMRRRRRMGLIETSLVDSRYGISSEGSWKSTQEPDDPILCLRVKSAILQ